MPSMFREPRSLPEWIELDYFRRARGLRRLKGGLVLAGLLVPLAVVTAAVVWPRGRQIYQAGPLAGAHAMYADRCDVCHTQAFATAGRLLGGDGRRSVSDAACVACHHDHPHHADKEARTTGCAECHREHRGRPALAHVADGHCTACHADLNNALRPGATTEYVSLKDFGSHPEFRLWRQNLGDPGHLGFSHADHLQEFPKERKDSQQPIVARKLACGDCHQPDAAGLFMKPIRYEQHCQKCHPLLPPIAGEWGDPVVAKAVADFRRTPVPHPGPGQSAETVRGALRERLTRLAQELPAVAAAREPDQRERPVPGSRRAPSVSPEVFRWVNQRLDTAERILFDRTSGCLRCHQEAGDPGRRVRGLPDLAPPNVPERWFVHSTFSHKAHQVQNCKDCHQGVEQSRDAEAVLMPRIEDCRKCHGDGTGVRSDCATCHGYHHAGR